MNEFFRKAVERLGYRQKAYQSVFAGSTMHQVMVDLAKYSGAFVTDPDGMSHDALMMMHGRRQMFFRIFAQLNLSPLELEEITKPALMAAAARLSRGETNE